MLWNKGSLRRALESFQEELTGYLSRLERLESAPTPGDRVTNLEELATSHNVHLDKLHEKIKELTFAVSEGIERTDRAERRVRGVIQRARKELGKLGYEDPGLEAEAHELRAVDGDGSKDSGVPPVSEEVAAVEPAPSSIRGVSAELLRRRWSFLK